MEQTKIPMLSRFDTISSIMPYYSATHRAFLLLSSLCSATRWKLDEQYWAFINWMSSHWMLLNIKPDNSYKKLFLPNDLFEMNIEWWDSEYSDEFFKFIKNLHESKGWYFNEN